MTVVLDTHAFLWLGDSSGGQATRAMRALWKRADIDFGLSIASVWEMSIKAGLGKLVLPMTLPETIQAGVDQGLRILPIRVEYAYRVESLPRLHGDPFDRLLAATCLVEGWSLMSADAIFDDYGVKRVGK